LQAIDWALEPTSS